MKVHAVNFGDVVQEGVVGDIGGWRRRWRGCGGVLVLEGGHDRPNWERPQPRGPGTHGKLKKLKWKVYFPTHLWNWKVLLTQRVAHILLKIRGKKHLRFALCLMLMQDQTNINCTKGKLIEISLDYPKKIMTPWYFMLRDLFESTSTAILKYLLLSIKISNAPNRDPRELHLLESLKISNRYKCAPAKRHRRHIKNMYLSNIFQAFPFFSFACLSESLKSKK